MSRNAQWVMGEVLLQGESPAWVWEDHAGILDAIRDRDADAAEVLVRGHPERGATLIFDAMDRAGLEDDGDDVDLVVQEPRAAD